MKNVNKINYLAVLGIAQTVNVSIVSILYIYSYI